MILYDEEELKLKNEKNKKLKKYILIGIITSVILITALMILIFYLMYNPNKITVFVDNVESKRLEQLFQYDTSDDGNMVIYAPIKELADFFKYKSNYGEYTTNLEDTDSCYVEIKDSEEKLQEVAIFTLNSRSIYKIDMSKQNNNSEYEYEEIKMDNPIKKINDVLYVDSYGLKKAFNITLSYEEKSKKIQIQTLDSLVNNAKQIIEKNAKTDTKYGELDDKYANKKALLDNMMVVVSQDDNKKGVRNFNTGKELLGSQYNDITYISQKIAFLIKDANNKVGISGPNVRIQPQYDNLTLIDADNELYLAESNGLYGVIDKNENTKIYMEYNKIGVDVGNYSANGLKNGYVLLEKIIPVKKQDKWEFFRIETSQNQDGTKKVECVPIENFECNNIGCITKTQGGTIGNLMVIPEYNLIVVEKYGGYYGFMNFNGVLPFGAGFTDTYIETISGKKRYCMIHYKDTSKVYNVIEELQKRGYTKIE